MAEMDDAVKKHIEGMNQIQADKDKAATEASKSWSQDDNGFIMTAVRKVMGDNRVPEKQRR